MNRTQGWSAPDEQMQNLEFCQQFVEYLLSALSQRGNHAILPKYVPSKIRLNQRVRGDRPIGHGTFAEPGDYACQSNQWGAVSVVASDGKVLGIKPNECQILEFRKNGCLVDVPF